MSIRNTVQHPSGKAFYGEIAFEFPELKIHYRFSRYKIEQESYDRIQKYFRTRVEFLHVLQGCPDVSKFAL